jgi:hypothetical protein
MKKCMNLLAEAVPSTIGHRQKYTIEWKKPDRLLFNDLSRSFRHFCFSEPSDVCLLQAQKFSDKLTPIEILILNFCHTIDDIKELQKHPERLSFLNLEPKEIDALLAVSVKHSISNPLFLGSSFCI